MRVHSSWRFTIELPPGHPYTFSLHAARNFPHVKASSHCDIGLPDGCGDADYLEALAMGLRHVMRAAHPQLVIYNAGADPYHGDTLGRLGVSMAGLCARDEQVLAARGYCHDHAGDIDDTVAIHAGTVAAADAAHVRRRPRQGESA